jgi:hypothetical protein
MVHFKFLPWRMLYARRINQVDHIHHEIPSQDAFFDWLPFDRSLPGTATPLPALETGWLVFIGSEFNLATGLG